MTKESTKETLVRHAKSAGLTFFTALSIELYAGIQQATTWSDVSWGLLFSAATFTAVRSTLKVWVEQ